MSFPKAKIHRFNEETTCAPPPGRYDPKMETKVKGAVLLTSKRFPDQQCSSASLDNLDKAPSSHVTFRTPQVQRKVMLTPRLKHLSQANYDTPGSDSSLSSAKSEERLCKLQKEHTKADYHRLENEMSALAEKHFNELHDRNLEIAKLKEDLKKHKDQEEKYKRILKEKKTQSEERSKELIEVKTNLDTMVEKLTDERTELERYTTELQEQLSELQVKIKDLELIITAKQKVICNLNEHNLKLDNMVKDLRDEKKKYEEELIRVEEENLNNLKQVIVGADKRLQEVEEQLENKIKQVSKEFNDAEEKMQIEYQSKINFMSHEFNKKGQEMEAELKRYFLKIKETEKKTNEYITQFLKDLNEAEESCKYLHRELCKVENERDDLVTSDLEKKLIISDFQNKTDALENELEQYRSKCKKYEITLNTMNETINALSSRLLSSENEVERLNDVELDLEKQKKLLEEKSQLLLLDITAIRENMDKMEKDIICDVVAMREHLAAKVEYFKVEAARQVEVLNNRVQEKQSAIDLLIRDNEYYRKEINIKDDNLKTSHAKLKEYKVEMVNLKSYCSILQEEFNDKLKAQENLYAILNGKFESANKVISDLQNLKLNNENQIDILRAEINKLQITAEKARENLSVLNNKNSALISEVNSVQEKLKPYQALIEEKNKNEIKQKQYIDELIADLVVEKEQCIMLEKERDEIIQSKIIAEEKLTKSQEYVERLENNINELQDSLRSAEEEIKIDMPNLRQDNVNKAEHILDLSMKLDNLNETISEAEMKISCLEAEKSSLQIQLEELKTQTDNMLSEKTNQVFNLIKEKNFMKEKYLESVEQNSNLHNIIQRRNEQLQVSLDLPQNLHDAEERIEELHQKHVNNQEKCLKMQETINELELKNAALTKSNCDLSSKLTEADGKVREVEDELGMKEVNLNNYAEKLSEAKKTIKLLEEKIHEFETKLKSKEDEPCLAEENARLRDEVGSLTLQLQMTTEDRNKLDQELADLMGHHNNKQKIRHVTQLKQHNAELREKMEKLEVENFRLKKKLDEGKENANVQHQNPKTKSSVPVKQPLSPVVFNRMN